MKNDLFISVIIPVYNVEPYLQECILSVINQTYRNFEVILVNDGSSDSSRSICLEFANNHQRIKLIDKANGGLSSARNEGLKHAQGEYILFLDSDDYWSDISILSSIVDQTDESYDFIIFNYNQYFQNDKLLIPNINYLETDFPKKSNKYEKFHMFARKGHFPMSAWSKLIKKQFLVDNNISFIPGIKGEDIPWFLDLLNCSSNFLVLNDRLVNYRKQVSTSITAKSDQSKYDDLLFIIQSTLDKIRNKLFDKALVADLYAMMAYEYAILLGCYFSMKKNHRERFTNFFNENLWLLEYSYSLKTKLVRICYKLMGLKLTSFILRVYIRKITNRS